MVITVTDKAQREPRCSGPSGFCSVAPQRQPSAGLGLGLVYKGRSALTGETTFSLPTPASDISGELEEIHILPLAHGQNGARYTAQQRPGPGAEQVPTQLGSSFPPAPPTSHLPAGIFSVTRRRKRSPAVSAQTRGIMGLCATEPALPQDLDALLGRGRFPQPAATGTCSGIHLDYQGP